MKINKSIKQSLVLCIYILLSVILTYPLILKISTSISEAAYGDPLLNTWILVLSNGYYAMFISFFVGLIFIMEIYKRGILDRPFIYKIGLFFMISAVCILPVFYPYIRVKHEMGFTRSVGEAAMFSADILSYLAAPYFNRPWGWITKIFWKPEGDLFLGLTAVSLAIIGIMGQMKIPLTPPSPLKREEQRLAFEKTKGSKILAGLITFISAIVLFEILLVLITGGLNWTAFGVKITSTRIRNPLTILFILILVRLLIEQRFRVFIKSIYFDVDNNKARFYLIMLLLSFIFSLGPIIHFNGAEITYAPYFVLRLLPGFDGLRVPARFIIMVALSVSIFASFGVLRILGYFSAFWKKAVIVTIISFLILFESASIPLPTPSVAVGNNIPDVYKWLAADKGDFAILEMPLPGNHEEASKEAIYMYYSTYHWKKLVNGYSGYFPPAYTFLIYEGMKDFPDEGSMSLLKGLNIKYLIIHSMNLGQGEWERIKRGLQNYESVLRPFKQFGEAYVYEIINNEGTVQTVNKWKEVPIYERDLKYITV